MEARGLRYEFHFRRMAGTNAHRGSCLGRCTYAFSTCRTAHFGGFSGSCFETLRNAFGNNFRAQVGHWGAESRSGFAPTTFPGLEGVRKLLTHRGCALAAAGRGFGFGGWRVLPEDQLGVEGCSTPLIRPLLLLRMLPLLLLVFLLLLALFRLLFMWQFMCLQLR